MTRQTFPFTTGWQAVLDLDSCHDSYRSPRFVPLKETEPGTPTRVEVTLLQGSGCFFRDLPKKHRTMVHAFGIDATLQDLLFETLKQFKPAAYGCLAELRVPLDGKRYTYDESRRPARREDQVLGLAPSEDFLVPKPIEGWSMPISEVLAQGSVSYMLFDFGAEWWWRVRTISTGALSAGANIAAGLRFEEVPME